jgi:hypothetical protein
MENLDCAEGFELELKIFLCPFNSYHKLYDNRKLTFHIARCKDRRGKSLYHCKYFHMHIFTDLHALFEHEATCDRQPPKSEASALSPTNEIEEERKPSATFCKYNCEHKFKTLEEREHHESICPNKQEFERKTSFS